jgi:oligoendopeptidase F
MLSLRKKIQGSSNPYLGVQIQEDLKWKEHINNVTKKARFTLGFLRRNLQHCSRECRKTAYIALVRSITEYGAIIWDPYNTKDINKLENLQRRGARFITKDYKSREEGSMTKMRGDLDLPLLQTRRQHQRLIFFNKVVERADTSHSSS